VDYRYTWRDEFAGPLAICPTLDLSARCAASTSFGHVALVVDDRTDNTLPSLATSSSFKGPSYRDPGGLTSASGHSHVLSSTS
jgi:hypothetical protein